MSAGLDWVERPEPLAAAFAAMMRSKVEAVRRRIDEITDLSHLDRRRQIC